MNEKEYKQDNNLKTNNELLIGDKQKKIDDLRNNYSKIMSNPPDKKLLEEYFELSNLSEKSKKQEQRIKELNESLDYVYLLHNGGLLHNMSQNANEHKAIAEIRRSLIREFSKPLDSELILIDQVVAAYWRARIYEVWLNRLFMEADGKWSFTQLKINMSKELHKSIDQANRQIALNLGLLKQGRQPNLNIKVKTENAYIAQNQQFNQDDLRNEVGKIINPK